MSKKIEDVIKEIIKGDWQESALDFVAYLRASEMEIPLGESGKQIWDISYKGEGVAFFELTTNPNDEYWGIMSKGVPVGWSGGENNDIDERTKEIVWDNLRTHDPTCHGTCSPGSRQRVFGKEFDGICRASLAFYDPDDEKLACMKKMVDAIKR